MIIKIDHITLYSNDVNKTMLLFDNCGYKNKFSEKEIKNAKIKESLVTDFSMNQSVCYLEHESNLDIEIVTSEKNSGITAFFKPFFSTIPKSVIVDTDYYGMGLALEKIISFDSFTKDDGSVFNYIDIDVNDVERSVEFWRLLGFSENARGKNNCELKFASILPNQKNCYLTINENRNINRKYYLNDIGFNCLAFITTSIERDCVKIRNKGFETTDIESIVINNKRLRVCFLIGANGELAELIEIEK